MSAKPLKTKRPPAPPAAKPPNISELSRQLGVSRESLRKWRSEGVNLTDSKQLDERMARMNGGPASGDMATARLRKLTAEAQLKEMELEQLRGTLVSLADIETTFAHVGASVRAALMRLITDLPQELEGLTPARSQEIIRDHVYKIMAQLYEGHDLLPNNQEP
jgi:transposase-like protein